MTASKADARSVTVRISVDLYKQLESLARKEKRSVSAQVAFIIERGLPSNTEQAKE